jgi:hypothetical protein
VEKKKARGKKEKEGKKVVEWFGCEEEGGLTGSGAARPISALLKASPPYTRPSFIFFKIVRPFLF